MRIEGARIHVPEIEPQRLPLSIARQAMGDRWQQVVNAGIDHCNGGTLGILAFWYWRVHRD